jgi:hypothetical protein
MQNLVYHFWTFLQVSTNFENLNCFLLIKTIRKDFKKDLHSAGPNPARGYSPRDAVACHTWPADKLAGPRPGGLRRGNGAHTSGALAAR